MPYSPSFQGWAARLLGRFYFVGSFWYWFQHWAMRRLPEWLKGPMTALCVAFFFCCLFRARRGVAKNLEVVLGPCGFFERQRRLYAVFHAWAWCRNERYEHLTANPRAYRLDIEGGEHFKELAKGDKGFLILTPHVGNFESGAMLPTSLLEGRRLHLVRRPEPGAGAERWVKELIDKYLPPQIEMHALVDGHETGIVLLHALRAGDLVSMGCDRPPLDGKILTATVFGRPFALPSGPLRLMRAAEVPAVLMCFFREGRSHYRLAVRPPIRIVNGDLQAAADQLGRELEWAILQHPFQWFTFGSVWNSG